MGLNLMGTGTSTTVPLFLVFVANGHGRVLEKAPQAPRRGKALRISL